jgi:hypothetical protein
MADYGKITVIKSSLMNDFYDYIINMPQEIPTPPFIADITLISSNRKELTEEYNNAFKSAQYIVLLRKRRLVPLGFTHEWIDQYNFLLFGNDKYPSQNIKIFPKEWFYKNGTISTYFGDNPVTLEISERKLTDIINMN